MATPPPVRGWWRHNPPSARRTIMKTRTALAALTLTTLALPLAAIAPSTASPASPAKSGAVRTHRGCGGARRLQDEAPPPRRLRRARRLEAEGAARQRPDPARGRGRQQPRRPGLGLDDQAQRQHRLEGLEHHPRRQGLPPRETPTRQPGRRPQTRG